MKLKEAWVIEHVKNQQKNKGFLKEILGSRLQISNVKGTVKTKAQGSRL